MSRPRNSTGQTASGRHSVAATPGPSRNAVANTLPPYKQPSHPLNAAAQQKLREIYSNRTSQPLRDHNSHATKAIIDAAAAINDILREQTEHVEKQRARREAGKGVADREHEEEELRKLEETVEGMTGKLEKTVRDSIDDGQGAKRIDDTLQWLRDNAPRQMQQQYNTQLSQRQQSDTQQSRRRQRDHDGDQDMEGEDDEEDDPPTPGPTPLNQERVALTGLSPLFKDQMERRKVEYLAFSHYARYAKNNDYIAFKGVVHDARYGEHGRPLARPETWFTEAGPPAPGVTAARGPNDDDDDIIIDKANVSIRCPLTLQQFKEPYTSKKCPHTFEKSAILGIIRNTGRPGSVRSVECPVAGCNQTLTASDLHEDPVLIRKIKRMQQAEAQAAEDSDSEDEVAAPRRSQDGEGTESRDEFPAPIRKREAVSAAPMSQMPPQSSAIVDLGDPSDEDEDE